MLLLRSGRPAEATISFLKASKFSWTNYVKIYQHRYGWNLRQVSLVFIYCIKRGFVLFL